MDNPRPRSALVLHCRVAVAGTLFTISLSGCALRAVVPGYTAAIRTWGYGLNPEFEKELLE
jgi:hypothetical protein